MGSSAYQKQCRAANRAHLLEQKRAWYAANKERCAARMRENYKAKSAEYAARNHAAYIANKEIRAEYQRQYRAKHVDRTRTVKCAQQNRRRALALHQVCSCCSPETVRGLYDIAPLISGEVDHRIPLALGGHHCMKNLQVLSVEQHTEKTAFDMRRIAESRLWNKLLRQWPAGEPLRDL